MNKRQHKKLRKKNTYPKFDLPLFLRQLSKLDPQPVTLYEMAHGKQAYETLKLQRLQLHQKGFTV